MAEKPVLPGFTHPGGPVKTEELKEAWMRVYATLMIINTSNPDLKPTLDKMRDSLAEVGELVMEVLDG